MHTGDSFGTLYDLAVRLLRSSEQGRRTVEADLRTLAELGDELSRCGGEQTEATKLREDLLDLTRRSLRVQAAYQQGIQSHKELAGTSRHLAATNARLAVLHRIWAFEKIMEIAAPDGEVMGVFVDSSSEIGKVLFYGGDAVDYTTAGSLEFKALIMTANRETREWGIACRELAELIKSARDLAKVASWSEFWNKLGEMVPKVIVLGKALTVTLEKLLEVLGRHGAADKAAGLAGCLGKLKTFVEAAAAWWAAQQADKEIWENLRLWAEHARMARTFEGGLGAPRDPFVPPEAAFQQGFAERDKIEYMRGLGNPEDAREFANACQRRFNEESRRLEAAMRRAEECSRKMAKLRQRIAKGLRSLDTIERDLSRVTTQTRSRADDVPDWLQRELKGELACLRWVKAAAALATQGRA